MRNVLKIAAVTLGATAFYSYIGQMVPQKETYPPEETVVSADMTTDEMVVAGQEIVEGMGTCLSCHTMGSHTPGRFPDLADIGARAATRKEGMSDIEYLGESLYEPDAYIVEGFNPGMLATNKPPISLSDQEILTVIAYLQSLGGTPTVTMQTTLEWFGQTPAPTPTDATAVASNLTAPELFAKYLCATCHSIDTADPMVGPSLYDAGARLSTAELYESIMEPDKEVTEGFAPGVMPATLNAAGFYTSVSAHELKMLVNYLAERQGDQ